MEKVCAITEVIDKEHPGQGAGDLRTSGFDKVLLDFGIFVSLEKSFSNQTRQDRLMREKKRYAAVLHALERNRISAAIAKAPFPDPFAKPENRNELAVQTYIDVIAGCEDIGCKQIIVPALYDTAGKTDAWKANKDFYIALAAKCRKPDTRLLLVNQCRNQNGHLVRGICSDGAEAAKWVDVLNAEAQDRGYGEGRFGFCLDMGSGNLCGQDIQSVVLALGKRIRAVILSENDGQKPARLLPFSEAYKRTSGADWLGLIRGLRETGFDGALILDMTDTLGAFSPLLRPPLLSLGKAVLDYFALQTEMEAVLKKYKSVVLFGAGNMCRAYMKCYGETYPPLFVCDNNSALWGTVFEGLAVKNPEVLRKLPSDCAVFICNMYYREIEAQLRGMGISNPIAFFNDEYMPSFHFDRLERI